MMTTDPGCCGMRRVDEDGCCVACGRDFFDPDTGEERGDGSRVANASLSSAALDLLEDLEWAHSQLCAHPEWCEANHPTLTMHHERIRRTIAKAKGTSDSTCSRPNPRHEGQR